MKAVNEFVQEAINPLRLFLKYKSLPITSSQDPFNSLNHLTSDTVQIIWVTLSHMLSNALSLIFSAPNAFQNMTFTFTTCLSAYERGQGHVHS